MRYIKIKNNGEIQPQALHLVGASSKRNDNTKIGQFGSGNKYALAYFLRNKFNVKVFAGETEIKINTQKQDFREQEFDVIYIDGKETSITTEMGKDWNFWQAIREIYCNAIDEGGYTIDYVMNIEPVVGETHFYIDNKDDAKNFISDFDNYFAHNKRVLFECEKGRILEKSGTTANIYRKGIKCFITNKASQFDYDFNEITVDENRLVSYSWTIDEKIWDLIYRCDNEEVIMQILHNASKTDFIEGCISDISILNASAYSERFKEVLNKINLAPKGMAGYLKPDEINNHVIIPTKVFESVRSIIKEDNLGDAFKVTKQGEMYRRIDVTPLQQQTIKQALYFFEQCGFDIPYEIHVAMFDSKDIWGCAHNNTIILSDIGLERGVNETCVTILEEFIHLKYDVKDKTRAFQDAMLVEMIGYMKKLNSFVI